MDILFIGLVLWIFGSMIFAELLPAVIELTVYLAKFLWLCVCETLKLAGTLIAWTTDALSKGTAWSFSQAGLFFAILIEEWRAGPQEDDDDLFEEDELESPQNAFEQALALLGLTEPFTQADLKSIYRQAMKAAHTDTGGTKEEAQALNAARDLIMKTQGWK